MKNIIDVKKQNKWFRSEKRKQPIPYQRVIKSGKDLQKEERWDWRKELEDLDT